MLDMKKYMIALLIASTAMVMPFQSSVRADNNFNVVEAAKTGRVATEVFGRKNNLDTPSLSPDGSKIVFRMALKGENYIAWLDLTKNNAQPQIIAKSGVVRNVGDREITDWEWVGNDNIVVTLVGTDYVLDGVIATISRLVGYDLKGTKPWPLAWRGAGGNGGSIKHINHDKKEILVQRSSLDDDGLAEVVKIDVVTGKFNVEQRTNTDVSNWYVDGKGVVRGGAGASSGGTSKTLYRSDDSGAMKSISKVKDGSFTSGSIWPSVLLNEPDMAYALSNQNDLARVYKVNLATQEVVDMVFETKGYDVQGVISNRKRDNIVGFRAFDGRSYEVYIDERLKQIQLFLDEEFGPKNGHILSTSDDMTKILISIAKPSQMDSYYFYDTETGNFKAIGFASNLIKNAELNPVEAVDYNASDGMKIQAIVTYPRHRAHRKNLPVIVMPHGGPFGVYDEAEFGAFPWAQSMAELGYVVIQPNYRGSGGYGAEFVKEGRKSNGFGHRMQDDLNDAVTAFAAKGLIDANRACIMGWSYGGYAAARGAQRNPEIWKCAIAGAGVYDIPKMKEYDTRSSGSFGASYLATAENLIETSSARNTDSPWSPIMIVAAKEDARIPMEQSQTLVSNLKSSGKVEGEDFEYIVQKDGTHNLPYEDVHIEWLEAAEKWANRFNPAYIPSDPDKPVPVKIRSGG